MKLRLNKNNAKRELNHVLNGVTYKLNNTDSKDTKNKMVATLMVLSTFLTAGTVIGANVIDKLNNDEEIEIDLPIEESDISMETINTNPGPILAPTTEVTYSTESSLNDYEVTPTIEETIETTPTTIETTIEEVKSNSLKPDNTEDAIKLYTDIFEVRYDLISPIIYERIYDNPDFYSDFTINGTSYPNLHEAIFFQVLDIVYNPGDYGYNNEDLRSYDDWETDLSAEELTYTFSEFFDINPFFAQAIEYTECGTDMSSYNYLENNNPAGIGPNKKFRNKATGVIYLCYLLKERFNITIDSGIDDLNRISGMYCTDGTENWIINSNEFYNTLTENGFLYMRRNDDKEFIIDDVTYNEYLEQKHLKTI